MDLKKFDEGRRERIMNTMQLLRDFANENLPEDVKNEVLEILGEDDKGSQAVKNSESSAKDDEEKFEHDSDDNNS